MWKSLKLREKFFTNISFFKKYSFWILFVWVLLSWWAFASSGGTIWSLFYLITGNENGISVMDEYRLDGRNIRDKTITNYEIQDNAITSSSIQNGTIKEEDLSEELINRLNSYSWSVASWSTCSASPTWSSWGACSVSCGWGIQSRSCSGTSGTQTRAVTCKRNDGVVVEDSYCTETKPETSQSCNEYCSWDSTQACNTGSCYTYSWYTWSRWSCSANPYWWSRWTCSKSCGWGTQYRSCYGTSGTKTRTVYCRRSDGLKVSDSFCSGTKPSSSSSCSSSCSWSSYRSCNTGSCGSNCGTMEKYQWTHEYNTKSEENPSWVSNPDTCKTWCNQVSWIYCCTWSAWTCRRRTSSTCQSKWNYSVKDYNSWKYWVKCY